MQFIANGPDIPEALLDAHEEGRVVFFCGAGVSYPAGLPGFKGLVDKIYHFVGTTRTHLEDETYQRGQYDATLDLLERRLPGQRLAMRRVLHDILKPKLRRKGATYTHEALLQLAKDRGNALRLVTTNFDLIFEHVARRRTNKLSLNAFVAPMLPIPKRSRWNGLVYLHGRLPTDRNDEAALNQLVLTSGDFGLAYLTERWAARFVSELFRNYIVCFVGYSINDPVMRYMMDALAADRMLGEMLPQAYAFGDCPPGQERAKTIEWEAKGVTPILYDPANGHAALQRTLKAWADTYRDGVLGKERIVVNHALARPSASTQQDDFVGRMLWALSDPSGLPAKRFAEFDPVPSLDWLKAFSDDRYRHADLARFGVLSRADADNKLAFSLIHRPAPYTHAPWMSLLSTITTGSSWDDVMFQLARWLTRHLNDPALILWVAQHGGQLHDRWHWLIEDELGRLARLEREGKTAELDAIRANAPNAIPRPLMRILWRLLLTGRIKSLSKDLGLYRWKDRFRRDGLTATLRLELRDLLAPKVMLRKPFRWGDEDRDEAAAPQRLRQLVDWELVLAVDNAYSSLRNLLETDHWSRALPMLLDDFQQLLRDALDLLRELGEAGDRSDRSFLYLPSISPHWQNRGFPDWVTLIELVRDAWLSVRSTDPARARRVAQDWFALPYPTFKRLALFAASQDGCIAPEQWVDWLTIDDAWWLWSVETRRETMRLLVLQGTSLTPEARTKLEAAILTGPPRHMFRDDLKPDEWQSLVEHSVWLRLAKLNQGGCQLGDAALTRFNELTEAHPEWKLSKHEREEFSHWMSGTGDPDFEESRQVDIAPRKRKELVEWLKHSPPPQRPFREDTWRETCKKHFANAGAALGDLAQEGIWPIDRWNDVFYAWAESGRLAKRTWRCVAPLVQAMPEDKLEKLAHALTWWLRKVSETIDSNEDIFIDLCRRILALSYEPEGGNGDPVTRAINHPVGHVTEALLNIWFNRKPSDNDGLPDDIKSLFTQLCDTQKEQFRHGRVLLASRLIALFRVDRSWTETHLLPLFDWTRDPIEAKVVWQGFLWSPRLYQPLLIAIKEPFLATASHYAELGEFARQYAAFLAYAALNPLDSYTAQDFRTAIGALPQEGLNEVARALVQALEAAGELQEEYWRNRIQSFWHDIWPKSRSLASNSIAESLALLTIAARGEFPSALSAVIDWISPVEHPHFVVHRLHESALVKQFPKDALRLLDTVIDNQPWPPRELGACLNAISQASPELLQDPRYQRLAEYARRQGVMK
ncbi:MULTISPECIES: anti-phage defense-associated sirtuin Dsr1 [unclassified Meiothermus]|uniref:anti-phage defense-associated sirtuin Dsr1 n=1 Tax=unclassified Meiothermus TaxID=370471 RepID=UPI000D7C4F21|nr:MULTISPECIES: anti-phage defense-associated sirtuin Dsr1 [unclassified Meiothermus]PZA05959.1 hypothetical protein DNA98_15845 [Meiothermus sp. Pnk-1]RYM36438.1 hypothetical protein EWH23_09450 [Meiothermus sp. PNK-Is4]